jgi:hypothetical protein
MSENEGATALTLVEMAAITAKQFATIRADAEKLLKTQQKPKETLAAYVLRLAKAASDPKKTTDEDWETLDETTQKFLNGVLEADEKGQMIPLHDAPAPEEPEEEEQEDGDIPGTGEDHGAKKAKSPPARTAAKAKAAAKKPAKAPPAKAPRAAKPPKEVPAAAAGRPGRKPKHPDDSIIRVDVEENPHRKGAKDYDKFKKLKAKDGRTIAEALKGGVELGYLRYAEKRGIITIKAPAKKAA